MKPPFLSSICNNCGKIFQYTDNGKLRTTCGCMRVKKPSLKQLKVELDAAISKCIRTKFPQCQLCGRKATVAYHVISRRHLNTRWDMSNILSTCSPCNFGEKYNPHKYIAKFIRMFGVEEFLRLENLSRIPFKPNRKYFEETLGLYDY